MTHGLDVSARGARVQSERADLIARNLAHSGTTGFRRVLAGIVARDGRPELQQAVDRRAGGPESTGRALDVALQSPGFFQVRDLSTNETYFTRAGSFALDANGQLVTADGRRAVMGADGRGLGIDVRASGAVRAGHDGRLFQGDVEIGQLGVWELGDETRLRAAEDGLLRNEGSEAVPSAEIRVVPQALERSSVNPVAEMAAMIRAFRALEANLEMIRLQDAATGRALEAAARPVR
ncbi:MAG TPA: flagellar hook basal-body protein [Planctomycetota bacterium]|nr:flagellar hook basal-body protein [Planctomycetota bacterium]